MYRDRGLLVLGLSSGGHASDAELDAFLDATGVTFPVVRDDDDTYAAYAWNDALAPYPIDLVVDEDGRITYLAREYDPAALRAAVEAVLP